MKNARSPWWFIPSVYFQQGLPVIVVQQLSVILYKKLGVPNDEIGLWTSLITWPWVLKMFWAPMVDLKASRRQWVFAMQILIAVSLMASAFFVTSPQFLVITLGIFVVTAFFSATHDIALDGYYLVTLDKEQQAFFVGIRSTFFRLAMIFCTGALVIFAGSLEKSGTPIAESWKWALALGAGIYAALAFYARWAMPKSPLDRAVGSTPPSSSVTTLAASSASQDRPGFSEAFRSFFAQKQVGIILLFILLYRFGESMLGKMSGLFLLDTRSDGGLGLDVVQVGMITGNVGVISLVVGGLLGGMAISRFGLRACLWPMVLAMNLPNFLYIWAAYAQPGTGAVYGIIALDQFGYGFGLASYLVYVMYICQGSRFQASHYAIASGLMALGAMTAGITSGYLQKYLGWYGFFGAVCLFTIPGIVLLQLIPLDRERMTAQVPVLDDA